MPQLHLYVPDALSRQIKARARARGLSVSRYMAAIIRRDLSDEWPAGFWEEVVGGWQGKPLQRAAQGRLEKREAL